MNRRAALTGLLPLLLVVLGLIARGLAARAFAAFTGYETPFAFTGAAQPAAPALSPRVVLVVVDGLGLHASRELPFLNELRRRGADYKCRGGLPSLSLPARAVMFSGAWAEVHGQATNFQPRPLRVEHVFALARRRGLHTALSAGKSTNKMLSPHVGLAHMLPNDPETAPFAVYEEGLHRAAEAARDVLRRSPSGLAVVELHIPDEAGHNWGAASEEYRRATLLADAEVRRLAAAFDPARETLIVTGDHGHVLEGGHGGPEESVMQVPVVMAGRGVRPGARGSCTQRDIASTLSALLGLPVPATNQGRPLVDALDIDAAGRAALLGATLAQRTTFVQRYAPAFTAAIPVAATGADEGELQRRLDSLEATFVQARGTRMAAERWSRAPWAALFVALSLAVFCLLLGQRVIQWRELALAWLCALLGVALYHALLPVFGLRSSLTAVNKDEWMAAFFRKDMALGLACAAAAVLAALCWARRRSGAESWELARMAWLTAVAFAFVFVLKVAFAYWRYDVVMRWHLPEMAGSFRFYLDALALVAVGFGGPLLALLAWPAARLIRTRGTPAG